MCGIVLAASNCCCLLVLGSRFFSFFCLFFLRSSLLFFWLLRYRFCVCTPRHQESPRIIVCHSPNSKASSSGALGSHSSGLVGSALWVQKENCSCWVHWFPLPNEGGFPLPVWVIIYYDHLWSMVYTILNFRWFTNHWNSLDTRGGGQPMCPGPWPENRGGTAPWGLTARGNSTKTIPNEFP